MITNEPLLAAYWICRSIEADTREQWLENRRLGIGASDVAGILGEGFAGQSAATVWESKVSDTRKEFDAKTAKRMRIGQLMEATLRAVFTEETGLDCWAPTPHQIHQHKDIDWLLASLDGICDHPEYGLCPVELKNVSNFNSAEWANDQTPLKYQIQIQHQMLVTGATHGYLLGLIGGNDPRIALIERNDDYLKAVMPKLEAFWGQVLTKECPIDGTVATKEVLSRLHPNDNGDVILLPAMAEEWDQQLQAAKADLKDAEARILKAENFIKDAIGDATEAVLPSGDRYTWKTQSRAEHVVKASTFRVLRRTKGK